MSKSSERDPAKFVDILRILNSFYYKSGEDKRYLFQPVCDIPIFKDIYLWNNGFKCLLKKKKMDKENSSKPQGTLLNPWRVLHGIQNIIVRKTSEDEQQGVVFCKKKGSTDEE